MGVPTNYAPDKVKVAFMQTPLSGFADDGIKFEFNVERVELDVGMDGEGARTISPDYSGKLTLKFQQTSPSNDVMQSAVDLDTAGFVGFGPAIVTDTLGTTVLSADVAWVRKVPAVEFGKEYGSREWVLESDRWAVHVGGNV